MRIKHVLPFFLLLISCASPGRLTYSDLHLNKSIVIGGQTQIDQGYVVNVSASFGLPGIWLAGHHTTHGAVFANLGNAEVGDTVCAYDKCYKVFNIIVVSSTYRPPSNLASLILQTSWYGKVLLVLAR